MIHICIVFSEHKISVSNKKEIINFCINLNLCKLLMGNFFMFAINFLTYATSKTDLQGNYNQSVK